MKRQGVRRSCYSCRSGLLLLNEISNGFMANSSAMSEETAFEQRVIGIELKGLGARVPEVLHEGAKVIRIHLTGSDGHASRQIGEANHAHAGHFDLLIEPGTFDIAARLDCHVHDDASPFHFLD